MKTFKKQTLSCDNVLQTKRVFYITQCGEDKNIILYKIMKMMN